MICCLNPNCAQPINPVTADTCQSCGTRLIKHLRGRYTPVRLLGRGGFGRTYLAIDVDRLNTGCVIKQFAPQTQGTKSFKKAVQLFEQEALRLNELGEHSQIPSLLAYFEHDQYLYLVQQMVEGRTLFQEVNRQGAYSWAAIRSLLEDLLPLLQFIHERGVIHRDITPTNIIRRKLDSKPVLIDFGVARQFSETILYEPGTRIGTEGYAPIEQLRSGQAYPSSDLYSLGATCLHLLTGCKPDTLYSPLQGRWLWQEKLQENGRSIDPELGNILERLVKDVISERFQTAKDALEALARVASRLGEVPGWGSSEPKEGSSLFGKDSILPISGPKTTPQSAPKSAPRSAPRGVSVPPTRPPHISGSRSGPASGPVSGIKGAGSSRPPTSSPTHPPTTPMTGARDDKTVSPPKVPGWRTVGELKGHRSWVTTVAFNPKIPTLVSGSLDDTIKVWSLQTGQLLYTLEGHARGVNQVVIGSGGQVLASCGDDDLVKVWNLADGALLHTLNGHMRDVTSIAIGSQGFLLASGSEDLTLKLWKLDKGTLLKTLTGSVGMIRSVSWTPQEDHLLSGGMDNKIRVWDVHSGKQVRVLSGHLNSVNSIAVSANGYFVASASKDRTLKLWELASGTLIHSLTGHVQEVNAVAIAPDNRTVISGSSDGTLKLWDAETGKLQHTLTGHNNSIHTVAIHRTGRLIASGSADKTIRLWKWLG